MATKKREATMAITITGRHLEISDSIREYVEKKIGGLHKYFLRNMDAHAAVSVEKRRFKIDVLINTKHEKITGTSTSSDLYTAIDEVVEKLEKQLRRQKEKILDRKRRSAKEKEAEKAKALPLNEDILDEDDLFEPSETAEIVKFEKIKGKPMSPEEAVMQMNVKNQDFMVFINSGSDELNILYRLPGGNYSLITRG